MDFDNRVLVALLITFILLVTGCRGDEPIPAGGPVPTAMATEVSEPVVTLPTPTPASTAGGASAEPATLQPVEEAEVGEPAAAPATNWEEGPITFKSADLHGNATASGEPFDKDALTGAHKELPFDTQVTVINPATGLRTTVRINDRLPPTVSAIIDISPAAAAEIGMIDAGIIEGRIEW